MPKRIRASIVREMPMPAATPVLITRETARPMAAPWPILAASLRDLRDKHGLNSDEMFDVLDVFFIRYDQQIRKSENVAVFFRHCLPALVDRTAKKRDAERKGVDLMEAGHQISQEIQAFFQKGTS